MEFLGQKVKTARSNSLGNFESNEKKVKPLITVNLHGKLGPKKLFFFLTTETLLFTKKNLFLIFYFTHKTIYFFTF